MLQQSLQRARALAKVRTRPVAPVKVPSKCLFCDTLLCLCLHPGPWKGRMAKLPQNAQKSWGRREGLRSEKWSWTCVSSSSIGITGFAVVNVPFPSLSRVLQVRLGPVQEVTPSPLFVGNYSHFLYKAGLNCFVCSFFFSNTYSNNFLCVQTAIAFVLFQVLPGSQIGVPVESSAVLILWGRQIPPAIKKQKLSIVHTST